jgi:hypothetical protein
LNTYVPGGGKAAARFGHVLRVVQRVGSPPRFETVSKIVVELR